MSATGRQCGKELPLPHCTQQMVAGLGNFSRSMNRSMADKMWGTTDVDSYCAATSELPI